MATRKTCDRCEHYTRSDLADSIPEYVNRGECALMGDSNHGTPHADRAYGWDQESYSAGTYVGPKFGCIHWVKKT